jgi:hypothetical protein
MLFVYLETLVGVLNYDFLLVAQTLLSGEGGTPTTSALHYNDFLQPTSYLPQTSLEETWSDNKP